MYLYVNCVWFLRVRHPPQHCDKHKRIKNFAQGRRTTQVQCTSEMCARVWFHSTDIAQSYSIGTNFSVPLSASIPLVLKQLSIIWVNDSYSSFKNNNISQTIKTTTNTKIENNVYLITTVLVKYFCLLSNFSYNDDAIRWKHFPRYWPFVWGIHRSPVNSPHRGQWRGALMFSLICA